VIITVTLNPALDKTLTIPGFALDAVNRVVSGRLDAGGKGVNVSKVLKSLGIESLATGFLGGATGAMIADALERLQIPSEFVYTAGETRTNLKVFDPKNHTYTDLNEPGAAVSADDLTRLRKKLCDRAAPGDTVLFAGSLPSGVPADVPAAWAAELKARGVLVAVDQDGEALREMIKTRPFFIKPNEHELRELMALPDTEIVTLCSAAWALVRHGVRHVAVSLGEKGALFADADGILLARGPRVEAVSTVGAGDALTAAYLCALARESPREDAARIAIAAATAKVTCPGSSPPAREAVEALIPKIKIQTINGQKEEA